MQIFSDWRLPASDIPARPVQTQPDNSRLVHRFFSAMNQERLDLDLVLVLALVLESQRPFETLQEPFRNRLIYPVQTLI
ncbi:hypothetical protein EWG10_17135 [Salmonella enterica subsp. enterica serovar Napoli]|uniref:Uncharacterized protein n=1 Tax=Salmonella enterica subsp. salamae serovar 42:z:1,5 TaxID=1967617 RepID=A0A735V035_SALER|nr:hypothetical protein [Salmonella enterica subsp. enterica serovar Coeln]EBX0279966.1 hypothetical protein [Salmonella enterica subsp. enterica serovar Bispebjerg]EBX4282570.1 hypothetical protein [Salmonella enterica subsp. enterica serovar Napoli]ECF6914729.1 hypothetical protein [Salmonella enterica subsp. enterica]ECJ2284871.1 hypothetical protein [Salmonella enterica subsp. diarizonae]ECJ2518733.1 hypothetical protein [Salmonella enterica subsp. salamae]ECY5865450.1 hypothetical protei